MKRREFIVLVDGAAAASQDALRLASATMIGIAPWDTKLMGIDYVRPRRDRNHLRPRRRN